jgi:hypothetical protein
MARGGLEVDMKWADGKLSSARLKAHRDTMVEVNYRNYSKPLQLAAGEVWMFGGE